MKEFRVNIKIKNNLMVERREALGLSAKKASEQIGICYAQYLNFEAMRETPTRKNGEWKETALKIADFYWALPEEIWPEAVRKVKKSSSFFNVDSEAVKALVGASTYLSSRSPEDILLLKERAEKIEEALDALNLKDIDRRIFNQRYGFEDEEEKTYRDIADSESRTPERIRQRELKQLRRLRHSAISKTLNEIK